jgi:hypothetical protein
MKMELSDKLKLTKAAVFGAGIIHLIGDAVGVYGAYQAGHEGNTKIFIDYMIYGYGTLQAVAFLSLAGLAIATRKIIGGTQTA